MSDGTVAPVVLDGTVVDPNAVADDGTAVKNPDDGATLITPVKDQDPAQVAKDGTADDAKDGAPETYETFTLPKGMEVDNKALESFVPLAKDLNLSQAQAQKVVDYEVQRVAEFTKTQEEAWQSMQEGWRTSTKSDKEIGGPAFDQSLAAAKKFLGAYGTSELIEALDATGMGNNPELIRTFARAGKAMGEDTMAIGGSSNASKNPEDVLYPNQGKI